MFKVSYKKQSIDLFKIDGLQMKRLGATPSNQQNFNVCWDNYTLPTSEKNMSSFYFWDISGAPFNKSIYAPYIKNITSGARLSSFYDYPNECVMYTMNFLSQIYYTYKNGSCNLPRYEIKYMVYYAA